MSWSPNHIRVCEMPGAEFVLRRTLSDLGFAEKAREIKTRANRFIVIFHDPRAPGEPSVYETDDPWEVTFLFGMLHQKALTDGTHLSCDADASPEIVSLLTRIAETIEMPGGIRAAAAALESGSDEEQT